MDPCNPNIFVNDARAMAREQLGVPITFSKTMSRKNICEAFKKCSAASTLPPMKLTRVGDKVFYVDRDSPLTGRDYEQLFESGKVKDIMRIAKKVGVVRTDLKKDELIANIKQILYRSKIAEPIRLPIQTMKKSSRSSTVASINKGFSTSKGSTNNINWNGKNANGNVPVSLSSGNVPVMTNTPPRLGSAPIGNAPVMANAPPRLDSAPIGNAPRSAPLPVRVVTNKPRISMPVSAKNKNIGAMGVRGNAQVSAPIMPFKVTNQKNNGKMNNMLKKLNQLATKI